MSDDALIKEKLELLKRYMYDELNQLKAKIMEQKSCGKKFRTKLEAEGGPVHKNPQLMKYMPAKHYKSYKRQGKPRVYRKPA